MDAEDLDVSSTDTAPASILVSIPTSSLPIAYRPQRLKSLRFRTAKKAQVPFIQHDIVVDAEDLHINNGLHDTTYGSVIAFQSVSFPIFSSCIYFRLQKLKGGHTIGRR